MRILTAKVVLNAKLLVVLVVDKEVAFIAIPVVEVPVSRESVAGSEVPAGDVLASTVPSEMLVS